MERTTSDTVPIVDPGQIIRINARFPDGPASVQFSFLPPRCKKAIHDAGAYALGSMIENSGDLYRYNIDTSGMRGGLGWWYFSSDDPDPGKRRAKIGKFFVRDVPQALFEQRTIMGSSGRGLDLLGATDLDINDLKSKAILIGIGAAIGVTTLALLGKLK